MLKYNHRLTMSKRVQTTSHPLFILGDFPFDDSDHAVYRSLFVSLIFFYITLEKFYGFLCFHLFAVGLLLISWIFILIQHSMRNLKCHYSLNYVNHRINNKFKIIIILSFFYIFSNANYK